MRKWTGIVLTIVLFIALFVGVGAFSVSADASEYTYTVFGEQAVITDVSTTISGKITIPSSLGGQTVTRIESYAFQDCTALTEVVLPDGVTSIGSFAFARCTGLTSVTIPASVTSIEEGAFEDCTALTTVKFNAENCETMGFFDSRFTTYYPVFPGCTALKTVTIGSAVKTIPAYAFYECDGIKKITIPNAVTTIGKYAFYSCSGLTEVTVGGGVTDMSESVFEWCESLKTVTFVDGVKTIPQYTFYECKSLSTVTIPQSITRVERDAFDGCEALSKVVYGAKKAQSESVTIDKGNDALNKATWQYTNCNGALNHTYTNACDKTCNVCGESRATTHKYDNACDKTCNVCKATRTTSHSYQKVVTKATLSANGKIVNKCKVCGYTASTTTTIYRPYTFKLSATSYTYNGGVKTPTVTVKDSAGKTISSSNYTVTYASGRKNAGTYTVKVTMKGNYSGTKTLSFKINPINISKCKLSLSATTYTYDGKVKAPTVTVKNASGTKLTKNTHYTVTYASGRKNVGTYKVTIKMKGNYTGSKTLTFKINPAKTTVSKITPATKSLKVAITKKSTQVTGYQVQYSTSKSFKSYKTVNISSYKATSTTIKSLKAKTTYYVRVRTYKTVNGTKYYSGWSTVKYAKTK